MKLLKLRFLLIVAAILLVGAMTYRSVAGKVVTLGSAPDMAGAVAQSMYSGGGETQLPIPGKDFNLKNIRYFDDRKWVVASVVPVDNKFDPGTTILKFESNLYRVVVAPTTNIPSSYAADLPKDLVSYLRSNRLIDEPGQ